MPQRKSAFKKLRQDKKRRLRNLKIKTKIKKNIKEFQALLESGKIDAAKEALRKVTSIISRAANKKIIHKNTARRKISRFSKAFMKITSKPITPEQERV